MATKAKRPLIGLTTCVRADNAKHEIEPAYADCVIAGGGTPVYLPVTDDAATIQSYVDAVDGLVLTGGPDIPPEEYGQELAPETRLMAEARYAFERQLTDQWLAARKPILAICLGCQIVNVALGGTLIQHIPTAIGTAVAHNKPGARGSVSHPVDIRSDSRVRNLLGVDRTVIDSSHHQAVDKVADGLRVVARSDDGVIEALETTDDYWGVFLQWHPERMVDNDPHRRALFGGLVDACRCSG